MTLCSFGKFVANFRSNLLSHHQGIRSDKQDSPNLWYVLIKLHFVTS